MNLIFDLDGTLLYTLEDLTDSVNFALRKFGFHTRNLTDVQKAVGNGLKMLILGLLPEDVDETLADRVYSEMKVYYSRHCYEKTLLYDGVMEMLRALKKGGHKLCIVSNKADRMVQILKDIYFPGLIDLAVGECEQFARKPAADMVLYAMKHCGMNAIYIGDSEVDILTAANAAIPCYSVGWGYRSAEFLREHGASRICDSPSALLDAIVTAADTEVSISSIL